MMNVRDGPAYSGRSVVLLADPLWTRDSGFLGPALKYFTYFFTELEPMNKKKPEEAIDKLIFKAADARDSFDAMRFSQAAVNVANALNTKQHTKGHLTNPPPSV